MSSRLFNILPCFFICFFLCVGIANAQNTSNDKHTEVALRMLGHEILLRAGDSTSRVLPITKENNQYRIQFESEFVFSSDNLVSMVNGIVEKTGIASNYIVEVEACKTAEIVYSFEMNYLAKSDIIPCSGRIQPKSCYNVLFTIVEGGILNNDLIGTFDDNEKQSNAESSFGLYIGAFALLLIMLSGYFFMRKKSNEDIVNPNVIALGAYQFDKHNTELIIDHQTIELTSKEADLLLLLYNSANTTVERDVILNMVWGDEGDYIGRTVDVFISKLRKKLEFDSKVKIVNVRGVGYKLIMDA